MAAPGASHPLSCQDQGRRGDRRKLSLEVRLVHEVEERPRAPAGVSLAQIHQRLDYRSV